MVWLALAGVASLGFMLLVFTGHYLGASGPAALLIVLLLREGVVRRAKARAASRPAVPGGLASNAADVPSIVPHDWRISGGQRVFAWVLVGLGIAGVLFALVGAVFSPVDQWWVSAVIAAVSCVLTLYGYVAGLMPSLSATEAGLAIRNPMGRRLVRW